ncbi:Long chain acyl-CoA synthetase 7, peroxisomal [Hibiscus syriacus]|uniref:Long chain acyl-CoA synthetase 7, peroxisomal n=1 Tax=Hibiscus syriacus TaxID=106335 RepID=A0A6A3CBP7_HIBSY|nr:Long chain acyl-CoA synthetase 7, peroxisomal [Hibiscus syriacus]
MESPARRRLTAINSHLHPSPAAEEEVSVIRRNVTSSSSPPFFDDQQYSVVLPEKLQTGKWNVYRSARSPMKLLGRFEDHPEIGTLHENFVHAVEAYRDYKYLGTRIRVDGTVGEYKWMTFGEAATAREAIGSGLRYYGLEQGACVGLYFINRPEWLVVDHACAAYSYISVPLYDTLGPDAVKFVVNHSGIKAIFCVPETLNTLLTFISQIPSVQFIVVVGGADEHLPSLPSASGVKFISYLKLLGQGRSNLQPFCPPKSDDATICYTSGTTGTPKLHFLSSFGAYYERSNQVICLHNGVGVGFYQGDNLKLMDDLASLRPTIFCSVPRLYNRIYAGITNAVSTSGGLKERLFRAAYNSKRQAIVNGRNPSPIWDKLVFNKIKEKLGGRVRIMGSGASPLSPDVADFLRVGLEATSIQTGNTGYGMTETSCIITLMDVGDITIGHVGSPCAGCEVKLVDVPEMNYTSEDDPYPRGEIVREVFDDDWFHTGDIGLWKKNIFKLAQGEYIAPEKIENVYAKCKFVAQCFVYGDSFNSSLVAVVAVEPDVLREWAASQGIQHEDLGQLCNDPRARNAVLTEMDNVGREAQLRGFEFAKAVTLVPEPFTLENGLLTPTFKIKRPQAKEYFAKAITGMYAELSISEATPSKL